MKIRRTTKKKPQKISASELAWILSELIEAGEELLSLGQCLGEIRPRHLQIVQARLVRAPQNKIQEIKDRLDSQIHARYSHDEACYLFGVSKKVLAKNIDALAKPGTASFLKTAVFSATSESLQNQRNFISSKQDPVLSNKEVFLHHLNSVITPRMPVLI